MVKRTCLATAESCCFPSEEKWRSLCLWICPFWVRGRLLWASERAGAEAGWVFRGPEGMRPFMAPKTEVLDRGNGTSTYRTREFPATGFVWNKTAPVTAESVLAAGMDALQHPEHASLRSHWRVKRLFMLSWLVTYLLERRLQQAHMVIGDGSAEQCLKRGLSR